MIFKSLKSSTKYKKKLIISNFCFYFFTCSCCTFLIKFLVTRRLFYLFSRLYFYFKLSFLSISPENWPGAQCTLPGQGGEQTQKYGFFVCSAKDENGNLTKVTGHIQSSLGNFNRLNFFCSLKQSVNFSAQIVSNVPNYRASMFNPFSFRYIQMSRRVRFEAFGTYRIPSGY